MKDPQKASMYHADKLEELSRRSSWKTRAVGWTGVNVREGGGSCRALKGLRMLVFNSHDTGSHWRDLSLV